MYWATILNFSLFYNNTRVTIDCISINESRSHSQRTQTQIKLPIATRMTFKRNRRPQNRRSQYVNILLCVISLLARSSK